MKPIYIEDIDWSITVRAFTEAKKDSTESNLNFMTRLKGIWDTRPSPPSPAGAAAPPSTPCAAAAALDRRPPSAERRAPSADRAAERSEAERSGAERSGAERSRAERSAASCRVARVPPARHSRVTRASRTHAYTDH